MGTSISGFGMDVSRKVNATHRMSSAKYIRFLVITKTGTFLKTLLLHDYGNHSQTLFNLQRQDNDHYYIFGELFKNVPVFEVPFAVSRPAFPCVPEIVELEVLAGLYGAPPRL